MVLTKPKYRSKNSAECQNGKEVVGTNKYHRCNHKTLLQNIIMQV